MAYTWLYNYEDDILFIGNPKRTSSESIEVQDNFHLDIDKNQQLVAVEIWQASRFFKYLGSGNISTKKLLREIDRVQVHFTNWRNYLILTLVMYKENTAITEKLTIPAYEKMSPLVQALAS
ncbi:MAG: DUF2283 domain-containing protein [Candidatus Woesearchaeota archaeon]|nr:DUF2283 domain-containing protein [Candidatus Woesearchaeota archaeon]